MTLFITNNNFKIIYDQLPKGTVDPDWTIAIAGDDFVFSSNFFSGEKTTELFFLAIDEFNVKTIVGTTSTKTTSFTAAISAKDPDVFPICFDVSNNTGNAILLNKLLFMKEEEVFFSINIESISVPSKTRVAVKFLLLLINYINTSTPTSI
jgi:hypothetical protein